jgi:hypothetical protein
MVGLLESCIAKTNMDLISEEEARTKLADCTTLLKNMDFQIVAKDKF